MRLIPRSAVPWAALPWLVVVAIAGSPAWAQEVPPGMVVCGIDELEAEAANPDALDPVEPLSVTALATTQDVCETSCVTPAHIFLFEDTEGVLLQPGATINDEIRLKARAANSLIAEYGDNFDFFGFWMNFSPNTRLGGANFLRVLSDVEGLGAPIFDTRSFWGLNSARARGLLTMYDLHRTAHFDLRVTLDHEFGHYWMVYMRPISGGRPFSSGAHAQCALDAQGGMHAVNWVGQGPTHVQESTNNRDTGVVWGWLQLYLMGYASPQEMDAGMSEQRYMDQSVGVCPSASYKGPISTWSSLDLESANGVRFPVAANSQHNWKTAWIMIYEPGNPPTTAELDDIADLLDGYCERWSTITLGRGTMTQTLFDDCDCSGIPGGGCLPCFGDSACADELFCNGVDSCNATTGLCDHEGDPCADQGLVCYEPDETCVECFDSRHCDDGLFCNGVESCDLSTKTCIRPDADPCAAAGLACSEEQDRCVECVDDGDCASPERCDPASNSCVDPLRNCGNGVCDVFDEDCHSCPADCEGTTSGPQSGRFCCGNGLLEPPEGDGSICDHNP